jgi:integrase
LALRVSDVDFDRKLIRVRQSLDSATRKVQAGKSNASSADLPMPPQLDVKLLGHLAKSRSKTGLLFFNRNGQLYSANKLREKQLHPLLVRLGIPRGGFHAARHGATSEMMAHGVAPTVVQKQCATLTPESPWGCTGTRSEMHSARQWKRSGSNSVQ